MGHNHRVSGAEAGGHHWRLPNPKPCSFRVRQSRLLTDVSSQGLSISKGETPQLLCATCACVEPPAQYKWVFLFTVRMFCMSVCATAFVMYHSICSDAYNFYVNPVILHTLCNGKSCFFAWLFASLQLGVLTEPKGHVSSRWGNQVEENRIKPIGDNFNCIHVCPVYS